MLTAGAGRLVSPFANDPFALVALAFKNLYPEREYAAYFVPEVEDGSGGASCGITTREFETVEQAVEYWNK